MSEFPLSVLDLAIVPEGSQPADALRNSVELVQHAERLGYKRHWVAEHHNMPGIASSTPPVLMMALADATSEIRIGSGGVMLPNHPPLVVAEQFGTLEALHPGRIDLGIGRAPGTDPITAAALRRSTDPLSAENFPQELLQLIGFFDGEFGQENPHRGITAVPGKGPKPAIWLLGSSDYSAQMAAEMGLPFSFAHHFAPRNTVAALQLYKALFQPSEYLAKPYAKVACAVICAEDGERARWLAGPARLSFARLRAGNPGRFPTPEEAAGHAYTPQQEASVSEVSGSAIIGDPEKVKAGLEALKEKSGADELMITTMVHDQADRMRSYELVAEAMELEPRRALTT
jgi:luciferase family oxidoreductase group 1